MEALIAIILIIIIAPFALLAGFGLLMALPSIMVLVGLAMAYFGNAWGLLMTLVGAIILIVTYEE